MAAPDRIILREKTRTCLLCGSVNVELSPNMATGITTKPLLQPTEPIPLENEVSANSEHSSNAKTKKKRKAYFERMQRIMGDERKKKRVRSASHYVSSKR